VLGTKVSSKKKNNEPSGLWNMCIIKITCNKRQKADKATSLREFSEIKANERSTQPRETSIQSTKVNMYSINERKHRLTCPLMIASTLNDVNALASLSTSSVAREKQRKKKAFVKQETNERKDRFTHLARVFGNGMIG
jgi:hypothetical protein